tara:strand:+ start:1350 stop:1664 length:315 start_codon:yes stop_codon:yes gene_type:complete
MIQILYPNISKKSTGILANHSDSGRTVDQANEVALVAVTVPAGEGEVLVVVGQHLVGESFDIIPTIGDVEGEKLTVVAGDGGILDLDLVGSDRSNVHCAATLHD